MENNNDYWKQIDDTISIHDEYILSKEQRKHIATEEQNAYEKNIDSIKEIIEQFESELKARGFWTELQIDTKGFRFRFSLKGYYGPGGFSSQYHISGPLVLGIINTFGDSIRSFCKNRLEDNIEIGCNFDKNKFIEFTQKVLSDYVSPNNLIISKEQYEYLRNFNSNN
ncbi:hypothetical protein CLU83_2484 [Flavobacterium sp. 1]|uniref:hypothetical protein n=1 Tax=Flavobacterium sp. 1 TaxID=2035200 RepID=UPI000C23A688|nr:hypothetical protein [Flavobacterium sp. 1]PJJ09155.1 hypothetical protein CLU83_2484 [Flavobacterium sp. 1]